MSPGFCILLSSGSAGTFDFSKKSKVFVICSSLWVVVPDSFGLVEIFEFFFENSKIIVICTSSWVMACVA